uniref:LAGLIDADG homing endonuclease n=1 Tax=Funneliformis caledonium TaxID=1117310 RepID=D5G3N6_9GLOM|nr:LAGLIDADG homing endonuclease [Funneliformis caledonium]
MFLWTNEAIQHTRLLDLTPVVCLVSITIVRSFILTPAWGPRALSPWAEGGIKIVPANIKELLTARGLAYWAMDDGYKDRGNFRFATESFSRDDVLLLLEVLKENLDCSLNTVQSTQYRIYVKTNSMVQFRALISPYFFPSMLYKLQ